MFSINPKLTQQNPIGPIRITMPAKVAYNRDVFQETLVDVLEQLGCRTCFSGADCTFQTEREFIVNTAFKAEPHTTQTYFDAKGANADVLISEPRSTYDLDSVNSILDKVLEELGCLACCSGFDITFRTELERLSPTRIQI